MTSYWSKDLRTMTRDELYSHREECYERAASIDSEMQRRDALPFVWENEVEIVKQIRSISATTTEPSSEMEDWVEPRSILDSYIRGDKVRHSGSSWVAVGPGAIYTQPGVNDVIKGECWEKLDDQLEA